MVSMPNKKTREREIFLEAIDIPSEKARRQFIEEACSQDKPLRDRLMALLRAHEDSTGFLPPEPTDITDAISPPPGTRIGRYRLLKRIGEGGFGMVYLAEQEEPVRRQVALKILKAGMDTRQVIARFEAERQALAMMDHHHIAKVHDAGATEQGRPYFVMEHVPGIPITRYCQNNKLDLKERLSLFAEICGAVQHAHQKGIIHRDLKPSNVLVFQYNSEETDSPPETSGGIKPTVKIIDFGIAKAMDDPLTDKTLVTKSQQFLGTPDYMSPEQAGLGKGDVDTRSDIYSLGVLLYELLTGETPLGSKSHSKESSEELRRRIREEIPKRPSTRTRMPEATIKDTETNPSPGIGRHLPRDLDWIVLKALEKDREERYDSANALEEDIQRFLNHQPVNAAAPSLRYQFAKFVQRNRRMVWTTFSVAAAIVLGLTLAIQQAIRARQAEQIANSESAITKAVNQFFLEDILQQAHPWDADPALDPNKDLKLLDVIDRAANRIDGRFTNQPLVEAAIRLNIGKTYESLNHYDQAEPNIRKAYDLYTEHLGTNDVQTVLAKERLAWLLRGLNKVGMANKTFAEVLDWKRRHLGSDHPETIETMMAMGFTSSPPERSEPIWEETLRLATKLQSHERSPIWQAVAYEGLAWIRRKRGALSESQEFYQKSYEIFLDHYGPDHSQTIRLEHQVAHHVWKVDKDLVKAESMLRSLVDKSVTKWGYDIYLTINPLGDHALVLSELGRHDEAEALLEQAIPSSVKAYGKISNSTRHWRKCLGDLYGDRMNWTEAASIYQELAKDYPGHAVITGNAILSSLLASNRGQLQHFLAQWLTHHSKKPNPNGVVHLAKTALVLDSPTVSPSEWRNLREASNVITNQPARNLIAGLQKYRQQDFREAVNHLTEMPSDPAKPNYVLAGYFLALSLHRLGQVQEAQEVFNESQAKHDLLLATKQGRGHWSNTTLCQLARKQAEAIIQQQKPPNTTD